MNEIDAKAIEAILRPWLKSLGYYKIEFSQTDFPGGNHATLVYADGDKRKILLTVNVSKQPKKPSKLPNNYIQDIKKIAAEKAREAWSAAMLINSNGELVDDIKWTNLTLLAA